jgi:hypothetical protein
MILEGSIPNSQKRIAHLLLWSCIYYVSIIWYWTDFLLFVNVPGDLTSVYSEMYKHFNFERFKLVRPETYRTLILWSVYIFSSTFQWNMFLSCVHLIHLSMTWTIEATLKNSIALVREQTIPSERPPPAAKLVPTFANGGCHVVVVTDFFGRILSFLDRSSYFFFQIAPQFYSRRWVDPVPDPLYLKKIL